MRSLIVAAQAAFVAFAVPTLAHAQDLAAGKELFRTCRSCHTVAEGLTCRKFLPRVAEKYGPPDVGCSDGVAYWLSLPATDERVSACARQVSLNTTGMPVAESRGIEFGQPNGPTAAIDLPLSWAHGPPKIQCGTVLRVKVSETSLSTTLVDISKFHDVVQTTIEAFADTLNGIVASNAEKAKQVEKDAEGAAADITL